MQQDRQHLFGGEQGAEDDEDGAAGRSDALPAPLANPQASLPPFLPRLTCENFGAEDLEAPRNERRHCRHHCSTHRRALMNEHPVLEGFNIAT